MSLIALPVTADDLLNLQLGEEFFSNGPEATATANAVNAGGDGAPTVLSYSNQIIANNSAYSTTVMAVDSLMLGQVGTEANMTSLARSFLVGQNDFFLSLPPATQTGAGGLNVWAGGVLGFALNSNAAFGTNFAFLNTGADLGATGNSNFANAVSTVVFTNTNEASTALGLLGGNVGYFTTNAALYGLTSQSAIVQAADGLTFGEMVGIALANPTSIGAFLFGEVSNALVVNGEFLDGTPGVASPVGLALGQVPPALPLQMGPTFTLTTGTDTAVSGLAFDGTGAVVPASGVTILAPPNGGGSTLNTSDKIQLTGNNNTLVLQLVTATGATTIGGVTALQGVQNLVASNTGGGVAGNASVALLGGVNIGGPGPTGGGGNPGLQTITWQNSNGSFNFGGSGSGGIQAIPNGLVMNAFFDGGEDLTNTGANLPLFHVAIAGTLFTGTDALTINMEGLTSKPGNAAAGFYDIGAGPTAGTIGYQTYNLNVIDATGEKIFLNPFGVTTATTINIADTHGGTGGLVLNSTGNTGASWANVATINGSGLTGKLTVSGAEGPQGSGGIGAGFLALDTTALKTVTTGGQLFLDTTSLTTATADAVKLSAGAGVVNELAFNNTVITQGLLAIPIALTNINLLDDATDASGLGGNINMAYFPLTTGAANITDTFNGTTSSVSASELQFVTAAGATTGGTVGTTTITNGPTDFFVQLNSQTDTSNLTISAGISNLNGGNNVLAVGINGQAITAFTDNNYTTTSLVFSGAVSNEFFATTTFIDNQVNTDPSPAVVNISGGFSGSLEEFGNGTSPVEGTASVQLNGPGATTINDTLTAATSLSIAVTNASQINDGDAAGTLYMYAPGTDLAGFTINVTASGGPFENVIDGSMGAVTSTTSNVANGHNFSGSVGVGDIIKLAGAAATIFVAGNDSVTLAAHTVVDNIIVGGYNGLNTGHGTFDDNVNDTDFRTVVMEMTNTADQAFQGFWGIANGAGPTAIVGGLFAGANGGTSADLTTVSGFNIASDFLTFVTDAWSGGVVGQNGSLYNAGGTTLQNTSSSLAGSGVGTTSVVVPNGGSPQIMAADNVILFANTGNIANATTLALDLNTLDPITLPTAIANGHNEHILFAYNTGSAVNFADVDIVNSSGASQTSTNAMHVFASDMVSLLGINVAQLTNANIHFG
jgi:hypothetical protein